MRVASWLAGAGFVVLVALTPSGCLAPTEIYLDLSADFDCATIDHTDVFVSAPGAAQPTGATATEYGCDGTAPKHIGTLVMIPSQSAAAGVRIDIQTTLKGGTCAPTSSPTCIEAKRSLGYIAHTILRLPVVMEGQCAGVTCPEGQTCEVVKGSPACVGDVVPPCTDTNGCGLDGGPAADVGVLDAPNACVSPMLQDKSAGAPKFTWSFDNLNMAEDNNLVTKSTLLPGNSFSSATGAMGCGAYLSTSVAQPLSSGVGTWFVAPHFVVATYFRGSQTGKLLTLGSIDLAVRQPQTVPILAIEQATAAYYDTSNIGDGAWHQIALEIDGTGSTSMKVTLYVDGQSKIAQTPMWAFGSPAGGLVVGDTTPAGNNAFDEVEYYGFP